MTPASSFSCLRQQVDSTDRSFSQHSAQQLNGLRKKKPTSKQRNSSNRIFSLSESHSWHSLRLCVWGDRDMGPIVNQLLSWGVFVYSECFIFPTRHGLSFKRNYLFFSKSWLPLTGLEPCGYNCTKHLCSLNEHCGLYLWWTPKSFWANQNLSLGSFEIRHWDTYQLVVTE